MESISIMRIESCTIVSKTIFLYHQSTANTNTELNNWLINAFNGEWLRTAGAVPLQVDTESGKKREIEGGLYSIADGV